PPNSSLASLGPQTAPALFSFRFASVKDGLLHNFLNAIFLRPILHSKEIFQRLVGPELSDCSALMKDKAQHQRQQWFRITRSRVFCFKNLMRTNRPGRGVCTRACGI